MQMHPLHFRCAMTFDVSVLLASFTLHFGAASINSSTSITSSTSVTVRRYSGNRRGGGGGGEGLCFVLLSSVVKRQSLPDVLQLLRFCTEIRIR